MARSVSHITWAKLATSERIENSPKSLLSLGNLFKDINEKRPIYLFYVFIFKVKAHTDDVRKTVTGLYVNKSNQRHCGQSSL